MAKLRSSSMRILRLSWVSLSLLVSLFAATQWQVAAQTPAAVDVVDSSAKADFPHDITFDLEATSGDEIGSVDLVYREANLTTLELLPATFKQNGSDVTANAEA